MKRVRVVYQLTEPDLVALQTEARKELASIARQLKKAPKSKLLLRQKTAKEKLEQRIRHAIFAIRIAAIEPPPRRPDPHLGRKSEPEIDPVRRLPAPLPKAKVAKPAHTAPLSSPRPPLRTMREMAVAEPTRARRKVTPLWQVRALLPKVRREPETRTSPVGRWPVTPCQRCGKDIDTASLLMLMGGERPKMHEACQVEADLEKAQRRKR